MRGALADAMSSDHIRTSRSVGLPSTKVVGKHALKNSSAPVLTVVGLQVAYLLGGTVVVESIFGIAGLGTYVLTAVQRNDLPAIQGSVMFIAILTVLVNLIVDISYAFLNPKVRVGMSDWESRNPDVDPFVTQRLTNGRSTALTEIERGTEGVVDAGIARHARHHARPRRLLEALPAEQGCRRRGRVLRAADRRGACSPAASGSRTPTSSTSPRSTARRRARTGSARTTSVATCSRGSSTAPGSR